MIKTDGKRWVTTLLTIIIGIMLAVVIIAPLALSSQDLVSWASSPNGLNLSGIWPYVTFVALDCAAALCVALTIQAFYKGESAGLAHVLVWVFAGLSAFANYRQAVRTAAHDDDWFLPAMSILGAVLLEVVVRKIRRTARSEYGVYERPLPKFRALRWIVAFNETRTAWKLSIVDGITSPDEAVKAARESKPVVIVDESLNELSKADKVKAAFAALDSYDVPNAIDWLNARGVKVNRAYVYEVAKKEKKSTDVIESAEEVTL
ncbi:DUF2637 domain-containing protein [Streptomyces sp. ME02-8801-2C]|uniref:DUF2637 domain-containing protein n=1 Tax=Streptomyces sp. ME02-8801-2C TaxID=3028680 RepID=UPI0029BE4736|nr:DUF2637 domain-containing protein [Streptomyces sp. ME02-8801-2C]MDX3458954.1 DUF2637 domain-containing protein [Streptomyces sp. ME02-8801-2C]